jgi:Holliday junction resolvasome RuvABC endonuclease subunit
MELMVARPKDRVWFFIEDAVVGRGGAYATIAQSKVHGAVVAAAVLSGRCEYVAAENNSRVKKAVVGKGNANKDDIKAWARVYWRDLFDIAKNDQDVIDAGMHNRFGAQVTKTLKRVQANRKALAK